MHFCCAQLHIEKVSVQVQGVVWLFSRDPGRTVDDRTDLLQLKCKSSHGCQTAQRTRL